MTAHPADNNATWEDEAARVRPLLLAAYRKIIENSSPATEALIDEGVARLLVIAPSVNREAKKRAIAQYRAQSGREHVQGELNEIRIIAGNLWARLRSLSDATVGVLTTDDDVIGRVQHGLTELGALAAADISHLPILAPQGRPADGEAAVVTGMLYRDFKRLSGRQPTIRRVPHGKAYGPFLEFVAAIFAAKGITASPEAQAAAALKRYRIGKSQAQK